MMVVHGQCPPWGERGGQCPPWGQRGGQCPPWSQRGPALLEAVLWAIREEEPWEHLCMSEDIKGR